MHHTPNELIELYVLGFLDFRSKSTANRPQANEPSYKVGADVARVYPKLSKADACAWFCSLMNARLPPEEPADTNQKASVTT